MTQSDAFERGRADCIQDRCENIPFASIGGLDKRHSPEAPHYISEADRHMYLHGYIAAAQEMYGEDWRTCRFTWKHALTIEPGDKA